MIYDLKKIMFFTSQFEYEGVPVCIDYNIDESKEHLSQDYAVLQNESIENIIRSRFIPWFKSDEFQDRDDDMIYEGLKIYDITYRYGLIEARYSPSNIEEKAGEFIFFFEPGNDYISDMMESVAMQIYVLNSKIVRVDGFEV